MPAKVKIQTFLPNGNYAANSDIEFFNRNAIAKDRKTGWTTTDTNGEYEWEDMDTGITGNTYEFTATFTDSLTGVIYLGKVTRRIRRDDTVKVNLRVTSLGEVFQLRLNKDDLETVTNLDSNGEIMRVVKELAETAKGGLSHATIMLESYIVEAFIIIKLKRSSKWNRSREKYGLGKLLGEQDVQTLLGGELYRRVSLLNELRTPAVHPKQSGSVMEEAALGLGLIRDMIRGWITD